MATIDAFNAKNAPVPSIPTSEMRREEVRK